MAEIRLSKLTKQFSIGLQRLVEFLNEKGAGVEMNPNAKVSDEYLPALEAKFGEDLKLKKDSEKVTIKLKEIIEMGAKKKPSQEEEEAPEREVVIKSNVLNTDTPKAAAVVEEKPIPQEAKPVSEPEFHTIIPSVFGFAFGIIIQWFLKSCKGECFGKGRSEGCGGIGFLKLQSEKRAGGQ